MAVAKILVSIEIDGQRVPGFDPYVRVIETDERVVVTEDLATSSGFVAQVGSIADIKWFAQSVERAITTRLNGQSDGGIDINAGGLVLVVDAAIDSGVSDNITTENADATYTASQTIVAGGT